MTTLADFQRALTTVSSELNLSYTLKDQQKEALQSITVEGRNVFAMLPTGYGKSEIFSLAPCIMNQLNKSRNHKVVVICPLRVLIMDQVWRNNKRGIKAVSLISKTEMSKEVMEDIHDGNWTLLYTTPESLKIPKWRDVLRRFASDICIFALDEIHCILDWGTTFRPDYKDVGRIRSILTNSIVVCTTATANQRMFKDIVKHLNMTTDDFCTVVAIADREQVHMMDIFALFAEELGDTYWAGDSGNPGDGLVEMFYGQLDSTSDIELPRAFMQEDSKCRCIIATIAFGMGIQINDVEFVLHWGPSGSILEYWQEVGRCGRDGRPAKAIMYIPRFGIYFHMVAFLCII